MHLNMPYYKETTFPFQSLKEEIKSSDGFYNYCTVNAINKEIT